MENWNPDLIFDLAHAAHEERVARINREGWRWQEAAPDHPLRTAVATALVALALRIAPAARGIHADAAA